MIKAIIIDDEPKGRNILQQLLLTHFNDINILATAENANEGLQKIDIHKPDVIFLDVEMPGKSGFDLLREAGKIDFKVVFVTAYNHYSLKAIKFSAFDYLLKPVDLDELKITIDKLRTSLLPGSQKQMENLLTATSPIGKNMSKLAIASANSIELIDHTDILYFEARGSSCCVFLHNGKKIIASKTLKDFEELLNDHFFFRIHHSYLVNLQHVVKYIKGEGGSVLICNNTELEVSRRKKTDFMQVLAAYIGKK
jgi:two-component system LytT family response regulator